MKQTLKPKEIIVIDDNTPDNSVKLVCEKYENDFKAIQVQLIYARNPRERSISIARNLGAKMAKEDIICFVDSDVTLTENYLKEIQKTFEKYPEALGVTGMQTCLTATRIGRFNTIQKLFNLLYLSENSGKIFAEPANLDKEVRCEWFEGNAMAFKQCILEEFQFDEKLVQYSFLEDMLFTGQINKAHSNKLIMTPKAKYQHTPSNEGRMEASKARERKMHYRSCRKHVMVELFGVRGLFIYGWQNLGALFFKLVFAIKGKKFIDIYGI